MKSFLGNYDARSAALPRTAGESKETITVDATDGQAPEVEVKNAGEATEPKEDFERVVRQFATLIPAANRDRATHALLATKGVRAFDLLLREIGDLSKPKDVAPPSAVDYASGPSHTHHLPAISGHLVGSGHGGIFLGVDKAERLDDDDELVAVTTGGEVYRNLGGDVSILRRNLNDAVGYSLSTDGRFASVINADNGGIRIYDLQKGEQTHFLSLAGDGIAFGEGASAISDDGKVVAACGDNGYTSVWDVETGAIKVHREHKGSWATNIALSGDGSTFVERSTEGIAIFDCRTGQLKSLLANKETGDELDDQTGQGPLCVNQRGTRVVSLNMLGAVAIWNTSNPAEPAIQLKISHKAGLCAAALSPNDAFLATATRQQVTVLDAQTGKAVSKPIDIGAIIASAATEGGTWRGVYRRDWAIQSLAWIDEGRKLVVGTTAHGSIVLDFADRTNQPSNPR